MREALDPLRAREGLMVLRRRESLATLLVRLFPAVNHWALDNRHSVGVLLVALPLQRLAVICIGLGLIKTYIPWMDIRQGK